MEASSAAPTTSFLASFFLKPAATTWSNHPSTMHRDVPSTKPRHFFLHCWSGAIVHGFRFLHMVFDCCRAERCGVPPLCAVPLMNFWWPLVATASAMWKARSRRSLETIEDTNQTLARQTKKRENSSGWPGQKTLWRHTRGGNDEGARDGGADFGPHEKIHGKKRVGHDMWLGFCAFRSRSRDKWTSVLWFYNNLLAGLGWLQIRGPLKTDRQIWWIHKSTPDKSTSFSAPKGAVILPPLGLRSLFLLRFSDFSHQIWIAANSFFLSRPYFLHSPFGRSAQYWFCTWHFLLFSICLNPQLWCIDVFKISKFTIFFFFEISELWDLTSPIKIRRQF